MLSGKNKIIVTSILNSALGTGDTLKANERVYYCPFCHHHKKKMNVNIETQKFHCWVCDAKGTRIASLLNKLDVSASDIQTIKDIYKDNDTVTSPVATEAKLRLPKEFKQLYFKPKSINPIYNQAIAYLKGRNITMADIMKYNMGYCETGLYAGRIIIPSYDEYGELNYFIARTFYDNDSSYKNPPMSRNVIAFENHINWNEPITLVEGGFDAFSVKRNVIPLLGKFLLSKLRDKIIEKGVKDITILMDADAVKESTKHTDYFMRNGVKIRNIIPEGDDAGKMGFEKVNNLIKNAKETRWEDNILAKLRNI